jgi:hypothetical protein
MLIVVDGVMRARFPRREPHAVRFDVDGGGETLRIRWNVGAGERDVTCRRDEIVSIRGDLFAMGLAIRIRDREIIEFLHNRPKVLRVWIAQALCEALGIEHRSSWRTE